MSIKSICNTTVVTIQKNSTLHDVSNLMQKKHVGSIVVIELFEGKKIPAGIITDRDIALALGSSPKASEMKVEQIMQSAPITVNENEGIYETVVRMRKYGVKRLPVTKEDGSLLGIVSADDILSLMGDEISNLAKINENQFRNEQGVKLPTEVHM